MKDYGMFQLDPSKVSFVSKIVERGDILTLHYFHIIIEGVEKEFYGWYGEMKTIREELFKDCEKNKQDKVMKAEDYQITIIKSKQDDIYTAYISGIPGLVVQVGSIDEIPKELAKSFEVMMKFAIQEGNYIETEI